MEPEKTEVGGKRNSWLSHVKKTMKAHKGKSFKAVLKMAKKTYRGGQDPAVEEKPMEETPMQGGVQLSPLPINGGRRRRGKTARKSRKSKKGSRKH
jgi:hypothetical protein